MWVGVLVSLLVALGIGFVNGYLVVRTKIPSFLITLSTFFMLRGINLGVTKAVTGTVATANVSDLDGFAAAKAIFAVQRQPRLHHRQRHRHLVAGVRRARLLDPAAHQDRQLDLRRGRQRRTPPAPSVCPVPKVKIGLFMGVSFLAWFYGMHLLFNFSSVQSGLGIGNEFIYIIAAVVGGACSPAATAPRPGRRSARSSSA